VLDLGLVELDEVSSVERLDTNLELRSQRLELQLVFPPSLLEHAERIAHRFAGILVFACLDDLLDESVLLRRQAYVPGRHVLQNIMFGKVCQRLPKDHGFSSALLSLPTESLNSNLDRQGMQKVAQFPVEKSRFS
jgi:hypothetical protein